MSLNPQGGLITLLQSASSISANLIVDSIDYSFETFQFDRKEYSNAFLLNLPNSDGTAPILGKNIMNKTVQSTFVGCGENSDRNVLPDDDNVDNILRKFIVKKYVIKGGPSNPSAVDAVDALASDHVSRSAVFDGFFKLFGLSLSYQYFYNLRNETFNYLTQSGLSLTGFAGPSAISESNCLIKSWQNGFMYRDPRTGFILVKEWQLSIDIYEQQLPERVF